MHRFLQYLYAPPLPSEYKYRRFFKEEDLTLDLLKIGHFYQVEDLEVDCTEYLKENICDEIVMDVWMEAERSCNAGLCAKAIQHLVDRPKACFCFRANFSLRRLDHILIPSFNFLKTSKKICKTLSSPFLVSVPCT